MAVDLDWQLENALRYGTRVDHRDVAWVDLNEVLLHFPLLVDANHAAQRDVVVTAQGAARIEAGFGPLFTLAPDGTPPQALDAAVDQIPAGAPYVLAILAPPRGESLDANTVNAIIAYLTKGAARWHEQPYEVIAGVSGQPAVISRASNRPFRAGGRINDASFDVRMDSWLPAETFRRGGFGHVIRQHQHVMALERGVNLIWFDGDAPSPPYYAAGVYAPQMRFRIPANPPGLARLR